MESIFSASRLLSLKLVLLQAIATISWAKTEDIESLVTSLSLQIGDIEGIIELKSQVRQGGLQTHF